MHNSKISKGLLLGLALLLAASAFAASKASLKVDEPLTVAGKKLPTGNYTLTWEGNGPDIQLNVLKGKTVVATAPARLVNHDQAPERDSSVIETDNGARTLSEIRFSGKKYAVSLNNEAASSASSSGVR